MSSREAPPAASPGEVMLAPQPPGRRWVYPHPQGTAEELLGMALLRIPARAPVWWGKEC